MRIKTAVALVLFAVTLAVYWQCAGHHFIILDDQLYVTQNPAIQQGLTLDGVRWAFSAASTQTTGNWHPVTWLSHMLDITLFQLNPSGHHLVNVALHAVNAALLFLVLAGMSGTIWPGAFVAAVFALHPLHVESVAWVAERKDVLSTLFWMLTLLFYLAYVRRPGAGRYLAALVSFAVGLMAKPMLVTLPLILLLLDFWPLGRLSLPLEADSADSADDRDRPAPRRGPPVRQLILEKLPFLGLSALFCWIAIYSQQQGGYVPSFSAYPLHLRLVNAITAYCRYLGNALWPHDLGVFYPFASTTPSSVLVGCLVLLWAITLAALALFRRHPYLAVGWLWFLITLVPVIGLIQVGQQSMADRYMYIPLIGLAIAAAWGGAALAAKWARGRGVAGGVAGAILLVLGVATWQQLGYWQTSQTLLERTIAATESNSFAHFLLGNTLFQQGRYPEALPHYRAALQINPRYEAAHYKVGVLSMMQGDIATAVRHLSIALSLAPSAEWAGNARTSLERCLDLQRSRGGI